MLNLKLSKQSLDHWLNLNNYYSFDLFEKFKKYFFDDLDLNINLFIEPSITNNYGTIYYIQDVNEFDNTIVFANNLLNIMICVENCNYWQHYSHYNKFGNYSNKNIQIYFYNHIDKLVIDSNYIAIPVIYTQMNYFNKYYKSIKPSIFTKYENKKYCLIATTLNNQDKNNIYESLKLFGKCDFITDFKDLISNKSCYHSIELLNLFNQYKFVFVAENTIEDGYITEKIFNCFFSRTIPIYFGSKKINYYFNENTFINTNDYKTSNDFFNKIKIINTEEKYLSYINNINIINKSYNDENYKIIINDFICKKNLK
jgi:hypothetical protein